MRVTHWTSKQMLLCLFLLFVLNSAATASVSWLMANHFLHPAEAAPVLCTEDADETEAIAVSGSSLFAAEVVQPTEPEPDSAESDAPAEPASTPAAALPDDDRMLRVEVIRAGQTPDTQPKRILIYHTHTWEAFQQVKDAPYQETEKWRSKDNHANMVAVGDALTAALRAMGYEVVHDITAFEPPNLSDSYRRSLTMLEQRQSDGEAYDLYIDLHRDAFSSANAIKYSVKQGGESLARIMVLIGKGDGYEQKPDWQANMSLASSITDALNQQVPELGREVKVKTGRFNQHIAPCCVLIECGCNYNTLQEVLCSMPYLAKAIGSALDGEKP